MTPKLRCAEAAALASAYIGKAIENETDSRRRDKLRETLTCLQSYMTDLAAAAKPDVRQAPFPDAR